MEVCRGSNSNQIVLYVAHNDEGYYIYIISRVWSRPIETISFYFALRREDIAVCLADAKGVTEDGEIIGIFAI